MENSVNSIKAPKIGAYFEELAEQRPHATALSGAELEEGVNQFVDGLDKVLAEGEEISERQHSERQAGCLHR